MKVIIIVLLTSILLFEYSNSTDNRRNSMNTTIPHVHNHDLMVQNRSHMSFVNYWADEKNGFVYQLEDHAFEPEKEIPITPGI